MCVCTIRSEAKQSRAEQTCAHSVCAHCVALAFARIAITHSRMSISVFDACDCAANNSRSPLNANANANANENANTNAAIRSGFRVSIRYTLSLSRCRCLCLCACPIRVWRVVSRPACALRVAATQDSFALGRLLQHCVCVAPSRYVAPLAHRVWLPCVLRCIVSPCLVCAVSGCLGALDRCAMRNRRPARLHCSCTIGIESPSVLIRPVRYRPSPLSACACRLPLFALCLCIRLLATLSPFALLRIYISTLLLLLLQLLRLLLLLLLLLLVLLLVLLQQLQQLLYYTTHTTIYYYYDCYGTLLKRTVMAQHS